MTVDERLARIAGPGQHPIELIESIERLQPPGAAPARRPGMLPERSDFDLSARCEIEWPALPEEARAAKRGTFLLSRPAAPDR